MKAHTRFYKNPKSRPQVPVYTGIAFSAQWASHKNGGVKLRLFDPDGGELQIDMSASEAVALIAEISAKLVKPLA